MSVPLATLVDYCDQRTRRTAFKDYPGAVNGLQFANRGTVHKIGAAVDAGATPFARAVERGIDFLIVHHGMFWEGPRPFTGPVYERVATLVRGDCAVYSSHLPLDGHPELGNNAALARELGLAWSRPIFVREGEALSGAASWGLPRSELRARLEKLYARVVAIECGSETPAEIAFCSGSGNSAVPELPREGLDTLVTGELREEHFNFAQENRLNLYVCGHYATEVHGVRALATELSEKFGLPWEFVPTENPL